MAANEPEKNIPSTAAKATTRSPNPACNGIILIYNLEKLKQTLSELIHCNAQSAFFFTHGNVSMALNRVALSAGSLMYVSMSKLYISEWMF